MLKIGDIAPDFNLDGDDGASYKLDSFADELLILYFYPKDNTPGCTLEGQEFTALIEEFGDGVTIVGVSADSIKKHISFKESHGLKLLLLSDPDRATAEAYGAYGKKMSYGKETMGIIRSTFVIMNKKIVYMWQNVTAKGHAAIVLEKIKAMQS